MAATVTVIPAREMAPKLLRVAAYCRVSSDSQDQLHSYATQIRSYTAYIELHSNWELVDIYADEGLTGTRMDKRDDFNRLMADCRKGKIDLILVKSVSRFARNTKDCLVALRELSSLGVAVQFEEENINTKTLTSEMMVSVFGSLAQQESISISQNQRLSYKRRMEKGAFITCTRLYGYLLVNGKDLIIYEPEAKWVRWIFESCLAGQSAADIAIELTQRGIPNKFGQPYWSESTVKYMLHNEKYIGDTLCQKTYTEEFPFVGKRNRGEQDQYYIQNTHPAIISRKTFQAVHDLLTTKSSSSTGKGEDLFLSKKITCGECGTTFMHRTLKDGTVIWCCRKHNNNTSACSIGRIFETEIYDAFVRMYNKLRQHFEIILSPALSQLNELNRAIHRDNPKVLALNKAIADTADQNHKLQKLLSAGIISADICAAKASCIDTKLKELRRERKRLLQNEQITETIDLLNQTITCINSGPERLTKFDAELFESLVIRTIAEPNNTIRFQLAGGIELTESMEVSA